MMVSPSPIEAGIRGLCPRCRARGLFRGLLNFAPRCANCGLDYAAMNVGDGPAPFLIFLIGIIAVGGAIWLEFAVHPPWWVHAIVWLPVVTALTVVSLRVAKGMMLALEWRNSAGEAGRE